MNQLRTHKLAWFLTASLALVASLWGMMNPGIYAKVIPKTILPGAYGQDLITIVAVTALIFLTTKTREDDLKKQMIIFGILGYLFYAYGIYVIERVYNPLYLLYLAIFTLSFWAIGSGLYALPNLNLQLPTAIRRTSIGIALLQPLIFYPLWISQLLPLMRTGQKIESLYSIYILDLAFIMPAFAILAFMLFRKKMLAYALTPALFILGFTLIFSLTVSELVKPLFGTASSIPAILQSAGLSALFLFAAILHLSKLRPQS